MPDTFAVIGVILVFILLGVLLLIPTGKRGARKKKRLAGEQEDNKDWKAVSLRLEKHIYALRKDVEERKRQEKILEHRLEVEKGKYQKVQEKLAQERGWQKKEKDEIQKKTQDVIRLTKDLKAAEQNFAREHGTCLRLEREVQEKEGEVAAVKGQRMALESQIAKLKAQADACRKDMTDLREENNKLSKRHEETSWVAKPEYENLQRLLKTAEKETQRLKERLRREIL